MLPQNLANSYARYKNDTDALASWLASTAHQLGYVAETQTKSSRKKGKNRKVAQKQAAANQNQVRRNYTIAIKDFTVLAQFIASKHEPKVQVPQGLARLLDRTIKARQWFADRLESLVPQASPDKTDSDDRHKYFLSILKEVREILSPCFWETYTPPAEEDATLDDIVNMFEHLDVEDTSAEFENAPNVTIKDNVPDATYRAEKELDDAEEAWVAFHFMLHDLNQLRDEVIHMWNEFRGGHVDLMVASIATNTAVDLVRAMDEDLKPLFARVGDATTMQLMYYFSALPNPPKDMNEYARNGEKLMYDNYNMAETILWPAQQVLQAFCKIIRTVGDPEGKKGFYGTYNPTANRSRMTSKERFQQDRVLLNETMEEIYFYIKTNPTEAPAEDEFTRLLRRMFDTLKPEMPIIFAATLFLDMHHVLQDKAPAGQTLLEASARYAVGNVSDTLNSIKDIKNTNWPKKADQNFQNFVKFIQEEVIDDHNLVYAKRNKRRNIPEPFLLFKLHPWLCGLWRFNILITIMNMSFNFSNAWSAIISMAHVYNAVRNEKMSNMEWKDMDVAINLQGTNQFFTGDPPRTPEDYMKRYALAMGTSVVGMAASSTRPTRGVIASKRGIRTLRQMGPVSRMFRDRFTTRDARLNLRTEDIEKIIEQSEWADEEDSEPSCAESGTGKKSHKTTAKQTSLSDLLSMLKSTLQGEVFEISFDYLTLHRTCWTVLEAIRVACRDDLIRMYGPNYITREEQLPYMPGYIFMSVSNGPQISELVAKGLSTETTMVVLRKAAKALEETLKQGDMATQITEDILPNIFAVDVPEFGEE